MNEACTIPPIKTQILIARSFRGLSQQQLADQLGVTWRTIWNAENTGMISLTKLVRLAGILNVAFIVTHSDTLSP